MPKLKVGDVVLIRVRVDRIDPKDDFTPYCDVDSEGSSTCFGDHQVVEVLQGDKKPPVDTAAKQATWGGARLTVGDKVLHRRRSWYGVGEIISDDHTNLPYHVYWPGARAVTKWVKPRDLIRAPRFAIGDRVEHIHRPEWGGGVVVGIQDLAAFNFRMNDYFGGDAPEVRECSRSYKVSFDKIVNNPAGPTTVWYTAEENLIKQDDRGGQDEIQSW